MEHVSVPVHPPHGAIALHRGLAALLLVTMLPLLGACSSAGYYAQAVSGHMQLLNRTRPVETVLADPATPPAVADKLRRTQAIRQFASSALALPDNASYRSYADLGRPYVVWNVVSTPELSLAPRQSCFLLVGCIGYRGFFNEEDARHFAAAQHDQGDDVQVYGVPAYSTLGWMSDPLLNTFLVYSDTDLARLIFHELAHQLVYVHDDSAFNEAFATSVELEGARRWLAATQTQADSSALIDVAQQRREDFQALLAASHAQLAALYASPVSDGAKREGKAAVFAALDAQYQALKQRWGGYTGYDHWFDPPPGNAHLASLATYQRLVPAFKQLLIDNDRDLPRFYTATRQLAAQPAEQRNAALHALLQRAAATSRL
ncbi:hypothetical protein IGB42_01640 [Andreprevotia sp. IGB-42]|uniref:aminopeptidase n=1 Tax=Andreprevotia sp. IGB-42 TaxID=2497473 RepID=UPI00157F55C6|nr:aminopeptidase [Andreprevotia sp. IGB-42]KAF0813961.1 hypothetical protein IGB42_01640 [Andreprevotia sp. IGB-42]